MTGDTPPRGRRALGRGLDALLPAAAAGGPKEIDIDRIVPNPGQPRQAFRPEALNELVESIREHGMVQPLVVSQSGDNTYRIIVGERRWRAARIADLRRVPVVIKDASDRETLELALVENVQREDLNPLEEAAAYQRLMQDFGLTQQDVARRVGKSRVAIANTLRLLALPEALKRAVVDGRITEGHARAVLGLPESQSQMAVLDRIEREGLNVRQTEELVRRLLDPKGRRQEAHRQPDPDLAALEDELRQTLGTRVTLRPRRRGGRIVIEWYSDEEFQGLYRQLTGR